MMHRDPHANRYRGVPSRLEDLGNALEQLVSREEMAALARATQYAHYTPEFMIRAIWQAVQAMGFAGGTVLEPGCGTGLFLAMMPEDVAAKTAITAIEMIPRPRASPNCSTRKPGCGRKTSPRPG
jgi:hypothetical protein